MSMFRRMVVVTLISVIAGGCGSRRSMDDIAAAAGGPQHAEPSSSVSGAAAAPGSVTASVGAVAAEGAETPVTSGAGGSAPVTGGSVAGPSRPGADAAGVGSNRTGTAPGERASATAATGRPGATGPAAAGGAAASKASNASAGAAPAGSPIRIGVVGSFSGVSSAFRPGAQAVQAWARWMNDRGGVAGHPVEVVVADDGTDPARYRALLQQLIEREKVIAFVYGANAFTLSQSAVEYLQHKRVPVIGGDKLDPRWYTSPMLFPDGSANTALIWNQVVEASRHGKKKLGWITCTEIQVCRDGDRYWGEYARRLGLEPVYRGTVSFSQPDFTAECLQARNAGVEILILGMDAGGEGRIAASCLRQNYKPLFQLVQTSLDLPRQPALDGAIFASYAFPFVAKDTAATQQFHDLMGRYAPGVPLEDHSAAGWTSAQLFGKAAARVGEPPTSEQILEGLWSMRGETLDGLSAPLTFVKDQPAPVTFGYWPMAISGGKWVAPQGSDIVSNARPT